MRSTGRTMLPLTVCIIGSSVLCAIAIRFLSAVINNPDSVLLSFIIIVTGGIFIALSVIALIAYSIVTLFLVMANFYRNLFTDEGYLTFTLPVSTDQILLSKLFSTSLWGIISIIGTIISGFIIIFFGTATHGFFNTELWGELMNMISSYIYSFGLLTILSYIIYILITGLYLVLMIFLAITIGAIIAKKHKIIASIGIYYVLNMAVSVISGTFNVLMIYILSGSLSNDIPEATVASLVYTTPIMNGILYIGFAAAAYIVCRHMIKNKLNLQ